MSVLLSINGHDYSEYIVKNGLSIKPVEIKAKKITMLDGSYRKTRAAIKDKITVRMDLVPDAIYRQLCADTKPTYFTCLRAGGDVQRTYFADGRPTASSPVYLNGELYWDSVQLTMIER